MIVQSRMRIRKALVSPREDFLKGLEIAIFLKQTQAAVGAVQDVIDEFRRERLVRCVAWSRG